MKRVKITQNNNKMTRNMEYDKHYLQIVSKCSRLHLSAYSFQKISGGHAPDPLESTWPLATRDFSPNDKS